MNALWVAEEEQEKPGDEKQWHAKHGSQKKPDECGNHQGPKDEGPAGRVDSHRVVSSLLLDEAETETGSDFRGLNTAETKPGFSGRTSGGSEVSLGVIERHLLHLIFEG